MSYDALRTIFPVAGWPDARTREVEITGAADPILPTPFRIGETSAAAVAAVGLAAADLWELRTGRKQQITVDTRRATASLRSGKYMKMDGKPVPTDRNTIMGFYPAKNGRWSYLHCNFPNHRAAALKVLGVPEHHEAVKKAVAQWDAQALEEERLDRGVDLEQAVLEREGREVGDAEVLREEQRERLRRGVEPALDAVGEEDPEARPGVVLAERLRQHAGERQVVLGDDGAGGERAHRGGPSARRRR